MTTRTENMWCTSCGATVPITADEDDPNLFDVVDAQWADHVCEIKGPGPRGLLDWQPEVDRPSWWWQLRTRLSFARMGEQR